MPPKPPPSFRAGFIDKTISERAAALIKSVSKVPDLEQQIADAVGEFRFWRAYRDSQPEPKALDEEFDAALRHITALRDFLKRYAPEVGEALFLALPRFSGRLHPVQEDLAMLEAVFSKRQPRGGRRTGKPSRWLEHNLLADVADLIIKFSPSTKKTDAAGKASGILNALDIAVPLDSELARRAIRSVRNKKH